MNKSTKGAFAASAAAVLLLGGAGSLAYWTDTETLEGGDVTAGNLSLGTPQCDDGWSYAGRNDKGESVANFVPGDVITKTCTFVVAGTGDNLSASLTTTDSAVSTAGVKATVKTAYKLDEVGLTTPAVVKSGDFGKRVTATITVTFPHGSATENGNAMQGAKAAIDDITVNLTQLDPNA